MYSRVKLNNRDDYFLTLSARGQRGVYCYRIINYSPLIHSFIAKYMEEVKRCGLYVNGKIQNPDEKQLAYFEEIIGLEFRLDVAFFDQVLSKWLPRLNQIQRKNISESLYNVLQEMQGKGKNLNILKNAYIKFMCWFYYRFERILNDLGADRLPKILYEGYLTEYELKMMCILASAGCDILLLQYKGDQEYLKLDGKSEYFFVLQNEKPEEFPKDFSILKLENKQKTQNIISNVILEEPSWIIRTNTWLSGELFSDSLKMLQERGTDTTFYYNMFVKMLGVEEKGSYFNSLLRWKMKLESLNRKIIVIEKDIPVPLPEEVQLVKRGNYQTEDQIIYYLSENISYPKCKELEKLARKNFIILLQEIMKKEALSFNKLNNLGVYLICWLNRYVKKLWDDWDLKKLPTFLLYGVCDNGRESLFLRLLSRLPIDVWVICPDLNLSCILEDKLLYEKKYENSMQLGVFPTKVDQVAFGTVAYQAEQELDTILYQDTGMYRNRQFKRAIPVLLQTTYEEISILWDQEAKYRPNFEVLADRVMLPVICAKISGVHKEDVEEYWKGITKLITEDTYMIKKLPFISPTSENPMKHYATQFFQNGKIQIDRIKRHPSYPFGLIREDMQDYMFDKMQQLVDRNIIAGTFTQGVEYSIVATILNLDKNILRFIQRFDFTKDIPKVMIISTGEELCSLSDSILVAFLSLIGFDVLVFSPTGYQNVERNFNIPIMMEYQVGEYLYDLRVPNLKARQKESLVDRLFRRGK